MLKVVFPNLKGIDFDAIRFEVSGNSAVEFFCSDIDGDWHYAQSQMIMIFKAFSKENYHQGISSLLASNSLNFSSVKKASEYEFWEANGFNIEHPVIAGVDVIIITNQDMLPKHATELQKTELVESVKDVKWIKGIDNIYEGNSVLEKYQNFSKFINVPLLFFDKKNVFHYISIYVTTENVAKFLISKIIELNGGDDVFSDHEIENWEYLKKSDLFYIGYLPKERTIRIVKNIELKDKGSRFFSKDLEEILVFEKELEKFQNNFGDDHLNDIYYWYKVIKDRSNSGLDSFNSEKSIDQKTSELIWGHCDEYSNRMLDETLESKIEFIKPRIKCFGFLFDKISDLHFKLSTNSKHIDIIEIITKELYNAKSSLYGAVKFAVINKVPIREIKNWYLNLIDDHSLIMGLDPFSAINKEYNLDLNETVKIYELDEEYRSQVPDWFMGPFYLEGNEIINDQFKGVIKLNPIERSIYQLITTNQKLSEGLSNSDKKIQTNPFFLDMIEKVELGKEWFKINNQDTYQKLFPEEVYKDTLVNVFIERINSNNEIYKNIKQEKDLILQQNLIKKFMLEHPENYNLYNIMAYNQYDQKKYKRGISYVKIVINKDPQNAAYYDSAGLGYYYLKDFHKSLEYLNKSIELEPEGKNVAEHYYNRGRVYEALKAKSKAKKDYERALEHNDSYYDAQTALNNL